MKISAPPVTGVRVPGRSKKKRAGPACPCGGSRWQDGPGYRWTGGNLRGTGRMYGACGEGQTRQPVTARRDCASAGMTAGFLHRVSGSDMNS